MAVGNGQQEMPDLPSTTQLLTMGGDSRIVCEPKGRNRYGCTAYPEPEVLAYGSSTASTVSTSAFVVAEALRKRVEAEAAVEDTSVVYDREMDRVRAELSRLCEFQELSTPGIIFGASGTDLHLFASQLMVATSEFKPLIVQVEASETGRGVSLALAGRHFSTCTSLGAPVAPGGAISNEQAIEICELRCRDETGCARPAEAIDAEVEMAVTRAAETRRRVLLVIVDVSKTGLIAPSLKCATTLRDRFPDLVEILVDACQFRTATSTLAAYLQQNFLVAITGSKFVAGPAFCGALLIPSAKAERFRGCTFPPSLSAYSAHADWPHDWHLRASLRETANYGLLLRWEAALTELRSFRDLSEDSIRDFLRSFSETVTIYIAGHPRLESLPTPALDRGTFSLKKSWDEVPTIFPFLIKRLASSGKAAWLNRDEIRRIHELLPEDCSNRGSPVDRELLSLRCRMGQPVACGMRDSVPVSALRLCVSTRLVVEALSPEGIGAAAVIANAVRVLDKASLIASLLPI